jgi:hypothetical protein
MEENTNVPNTALEEAKNEIEAVLKKYNAVLVPIVVHQGDRTFSRIDITSIQEVEAANNKS